jgi:hypothetical protein
MLGFYEICKKWKYDTSTLKLYGLKEKPNNIEITSNFVAFTRELHMHWKLDTVSQALEPSP